MVKSDKNMFVRVIETEGGSFSIGVVNKNMRLSEVFEPVFYLDARGKGHPRLIIQVPFSTLQEFVDTLNREKDLEKGFTAAIKNLLAVLVKLRAKG